MTLANKLISSLAGALIGLSCFIGNGCSTYKGVDKENIKKEEPQVAQLVGSIAQDELTTNFNRVFQRNWSYQTLTNRLSKLSELEATNILQIIGCEYNRMQIQ